MQWTVDTPDLSSAADIDPTGSKRYLVVEALPDGGWDWIAWADDQDTCFSHGRAPTRGAAMEAAEAVALMLRDLIR